MPANGSSESVPAAAVQPPEAAVPTTAVPARTISPAISAVRMAPPLQAQKSTVVAQQQQQPQQQQQQQQQRPAAPASPVTPPPVKKRGLLQRVFSSKKVASDGQKTPRSAR